MRSFDLKRLRYFTTVAEPGSVTRAASELHVAQPALSFQIRLLEEELGFDLFVRGSQGVRLTELGGTLAHASRVLLRDARALRERIQEGRQDPHGTVVIGLAQTIAPVLALPLLELAAQRYRRVRIRVREIMSSDIPNLLRAESVDFAFSYAIRAGRGIRSTNIFSEDVFIVGTTHCAKSHFGKANLTEIDFMDLDGVPLYLSARPNAFRKELEAVARGKKIRLNVLSDVDSVSVRKELALRGAGFTLLSGATIRKEILADDIFAARIVHPRLRRNICFVRQSGAALSHASEAVTGLIAESLTLIVKQDMWPGAVLRCCGHTETGMKALC